MWYLAHFMCWDLDRIRMDKRRKSDEPHNSSHSFTTVCKMWPTARHCLPGTLESQQTCSSVIGLAMYYIRARREVINTMSQTQFVMKLLPSSFWNTLCAGSGFLGQQNKWKRGFVVLVYTVRVYVVCVQRNQEISRFSVLGNGNVKA